MKLQILIPQYKETDEVVKPLLDSIALQQNVEIIPCYVYEDTWQPCRITDPTDEKQVTGFLQGQIESPTNQ